MDEKVIFNNMIDWAENEVKIACEKEHPGLKEGEWDYDCACYQSALKAYKSLIHDDHSGFSWNITASILKRLMDGNPLTPIEDVDDTWSDEPIYKSDDHVTYQCIRRSSLFKNVYNDGHVEYHDNHQFICIDIHDGATYTLGLIRNVMQEKFPITFPYMPGNAIKVYCEDFLTDPKNGDFDTIGIIYCKTDDGKKNINRYFKALSNDKAGVFYCSSSGWKEINFDEYMKRKVMAKTYASKNSKN